MINKKPTFTGPMSDAEPFVVRQSGHPAPRGLDGRIIALWQSHGLYFDQGTGRWQWQRPRLFGTVEDLFSQGYVMPYLMPMLENAGAYVMSPRERDLSTTEIIIDTDGSLSGDFYLTEGKHKWTEGVAGSGFALPRRELFNGDNPFTMGTSEKVAVVGENDAAAQSTAVWTADFPERGNYAVYVSYASYPNSATDARYTVNHLGGSSEITVNQKMGGGTWIYLGHFPFAKGTPAKPAVVLTNCSADKDAVVSADAVKIGGGMGNVARAAKGDSRFDAYTSGAPRFTEGARYWLQWAGMPESVYTESEGTNDYTDDYKSRALWVNYLAGGSEMLPGKNGLGIPIDLALAFHTDAGTTLDGSVVGTLGIYSTDDGNLLGNGRTRLENKDLTDYVIGSVVSDIRALHRPDWTNRSIRDKKYYEIRETKVPAMIIELLSHQNFEDMKFGLDPRFRFDVSRAVYKGILRFLARRYDVPYIVQPLPVGSFAITADGSRRYRLSWLPVDDPLERTATPDYYIVEERVDNGAFREIATVKSPHYDVNITDNAIHSYRIIAGNDGGRAFPSEVLSLYDNGTGRPDVNIVNGFTRISAPDCFEAGEYMGFNCLSDGGVPDVMDIISTGEQYEFREWTEFVNNERPGFGASRSDMEKEITMGNTHDFVYIHGRAVRAAGKGFISESMDAYLSSGASDHTPLILDIIFGKQKEIAPGNGAMGTRYKTFTPELQKLITAHCQAGGSLLVSGAYIGDDLLGNSYSDAARRESDKAFANDILGYDWQVGKACVDGKVSVIPSPFTAITPATFTFRTVSTADSYGVESPDAIHPAGSDVFAVMRYDTTGLTAATALCRIASTGKPYRVVAIGFPFETIVGETSRSNLMTDILRYLSPR
ncbi:MAG: xanthan lyase [Bacteroidales bacterium]|nr:xanthan lyase [Bacteroidales bacterium]